MNAAREPPRVTVITGASQGIGAGVAPGYPEPGSLSSIPPAGAEDYLTFQGDIAHAKTAQRATDRAHDRSGRIDTRVNKAGIYSRDPVNGQVAVALAHFRDAGGRRGVWCPDRGFVITTGVRS